MHYVLRDSTESSGELSYVHDISAYIGQGQAPYRAWSLTQLAAFLTIMYNILGGFSGEF